MRTPLGISRSILMLAAALVAGCGGGSTASPPSSTSHGATIPATSPSDGPIEVVGVVEVGAEHGCTLLRTDAVLFADAVIYQLMGSTDPLIQPGARLTVRGWPRPDVAPTCRQGTPFQVMSVRAG